MYDAKGKITRAGAEQAIKAGGSVIVNGQLHNRVETLPPAEAFGKFPTKQPDPVVDEEPVTGTVTTGTAVLDELEKLTRQQLMDMADEEGVEYIANISNAKLREKIRTQRAENKLPPTETGEDNEQ